MHLATYHPSRIQGGSLPDVAMNVLGARDQRGIQVPKDHADFKKLKSFFKNVFVRVQPTGRKKQIRDIQEFAGEYKFNKDTGPTTVKVRAPHHLWRPSNV